jgi:hypothetical protein
MPPPRVPYGVPTLKVNRSQFEEPEHLYQKLVDWSNDLQGFLQRQASNFNQIAAAFSLLDPSVEAVNGYFTLPNGVIIQWTLGSANNPGVLNALPLAFPTNIFVAVPGPGSAVAVAVTLTDLGHVTLTTPAAGAVPCYILAVGN